MLSRIVPGMIHEVCGEKEIRPLCLILPSDGTNSPRIIMSRELWKERGNNVVTFLKYFTFILRCTEAALTYGNLKWVSALGFSVLVDGSRNICRFVAVSITLTYLP